MKNSSTTKLILTDRRKFLIVATLSILLFNLPLILNNYYYRDDFLRAFTGDSGWAGLGRPFGDILAFLFSSDWQLMPESTPLFLFVSLFLIVVASCKALSLRNIPFNATTAVVLITFLFNPLFIECLLYRFDCIIMAAALACALLAWGYLEKSAFIAAFFCFCALNFYQTFLNVFIALVIIETGYRIFKGDILKTCGKFFIYGMLICGIALIAYYPFSKLFIDTFATHKGTLIFFGDKSVISTYGKMAENSYARYLGFLSPTGRCIYGVALLISFIEIQLHFYKSTNFSYKIIRAAICSFLLILILPLSLGFLYAIVGNGPIAPRMIISGIFFSVILIFLNLRFASRFQRQKIIWGNETIALSPLLICITFLFLSAPLAFSYITNNDIRNQNERDTYLVNQLATDLENIQKDAEIFLYGSFGTAPIIEKSAQRLPLLRHLIPKTSDWTLAFRLRDYGFEHVNFTFDHLSAEKKLQEICQIKLQSIIKRKAFEVFNFQNSTIVWLGNNNMCEELHEEPTNNE